MEEEQHENPKTNLKNHPQPNRLQSPQLIPDSSNYQITTIVQQQNHNHTSKDIHQNQCLKTTQSRHIESSNLCQSINHNNEKQKLQIQIQSKNKKSKIALFLGLNSEKNQNKLTFEFPPIQFLHKNFSDSCDFISKLEQYCEKKFLKMLQINILTNKSVKHLNIKCKLCNVLISFRIQQKGLTPVIVNNIHHHSLQDDNEGSQILGSNRKTKTYGQVINCTNNLLVSDQKRNIQKCKKDQLLAKERMSFQQIVCSDEIMTIKTLKHQDICQNLAEEDLFQKQDVKQLMNQNVSHQNIQQATKSQNFDAALQQSLNYIKSNKQQGQPIKNMEIEETHKNQKYLQNQKYPYNLILNNDQDVTYQIIMTKQMRSYYLQYGDAISLRIHINTNSNIHPTRFSVMFITGFNFDQKVIVFAVVVGKNINFHILSILYNFFTSIKKFPETITVPQECRDELISVLSVLSEQENFQILGPQQISENYKFKGFETTQFTNNYIQSVIKKDYTYEQLSILIDQIEVSCQEINQMSAKSNMPNFSVVFNNPKLENIQENLSVKTLERFMANYFKAQCIQPQAINQYGYTYKEGNDYFIVNHTSTQKCLCSCKELQKNKLPCAHILNFSKNKQGGLSDLIPNRWKINKNL